MADQLQLRGGTTNEHSTFTGALREVTVDTDKDTLIVHDAATAGGHPLAKEDLSNVPTGTITSTMIADGTIVNADINASAEIAVSKLADGAARQLLQTDAAGTGVEWTNNVDVPGTLDVTSVATFDNIASHSLGAAATPSITFTGDTNTGLYSPGADQVAISTGGSPRLYINSSGQVGVGTTSPSQPLDVNGNAVIGGALYLDGGATVQGEQAEVYNGTAFVDIYASRDSGTNKGFRIFKNNQSAGEVVRIDSSGRVGIGTSSPSVPLEVRATQADLRLVSDAGGFAQLQFGDTADTIRGGVVFDCTNNLLQLRSHNNETAVTIDSSERVGIGTTSPVSNLHVAPAATSARISLTNANTGHTASDGFMIASDAAQAVDLWQWENAPLRFGTNNTQRAQIDGSGRLLVGTSTARSNFYNATVTQQVQVEGTTYQNSGASLVCNSTSTGDVSLLMFGKSGSSSVGSNTLIANNHLVGGLTFQGNDGSQFVECASFQGEIDGTPGANDMPGRLVFKTTADGASTPTERMRIDSSGRVGVGTTSPSGKLTVDTVNAATNAIVVAASTETGRTYGLGVNASAAFTIHEHTAASDRLVIDSSGRVGIGTSSPNNNLHVVGSAAFSGTASALSNDQLQIGFNAPEGFIKSKNSSGAPASNLGLYTTDAGGTTNKVVHLSFDGKVGIGTTSPSEALHVKSTSGTQLVLERDGTTTQIASVIFKDGSGDQNRISSSDSNLIFESGAGNTERARIDSSGRLLVGTTSTSADSALVVAGNMGVNLSPAIQWLVRKQNAGSIAAGAGIAYFRFGSQDGGLGAQVAAQADAAWGAGDYPTRLVFSTTADGASSPTERMRIGQNGLSYFFSSGSPVIYAASSSSAGTTNAIFQGAHSATSTITGTTSFVVFTNGNVVNTNNSYGAISDIKLKENIVDASSQWDDIKAIQVRNYNFKEGQTHTQIGVVAQEVELVSPGLVTESSDTDAEGNDLGTTTKSVNYSVLYMKAVKALQEAMERIETLEAKVAALEAN